MEIKLYTKDGCPWCVEAKNFLKLRGLWWEEIDLTDSEARHAFYDRTGTKSVPQIYVDGDHIGGYTDLEKSKLFKVVNSLTFSEVYKPFYSEAAEQIAIEHEDIHWTHKEVDLGDDVADWKGGKLSKSEKAFITDILRLFTQSDVIVGQNYYDYLIPKFKNNEIRNMLGSFAAREAIHQRAYALLNETLGLPDAEYHAFLEYQEMADKVDFMYENDNSTYTGLAHCLAKSVFNEGVFLFASFAMLLNFQRQGKMKGTCKIAEWSLKDESLHVHGNAMVFRLFCKEHPRIVNDEFKKKIYDMARTVVELEDNFIDLAFANFGDLENTMDLTKDEIKQYIRYMTDRRLLQLGLKPNFGVKANPIPWLEWVLNGVDHSSFFEQKVANYEVAGMTGSYTYKNREFKVGSLE